MFWGRKSKNGPGRVGRTDGQTEDSRPAAGPAPRRITFLGAGERPSVSAGTGPAGCAGSGGGTGCGGTVGPRTPITAGGLCGMVF